jgi:hypothetical protein
MKVQFGAWAPAQDIGPKPTSGGRYPGHHFRPSGGHLGRCGGPVVLMSN